MTSSTATKAYKIDPTLTSAEFSVKHLMIATVKGRFRELEGTVYIDEAEPTRSSVGVTIQTASVDTAQLVRDTDLRSDNFFDVEKYPTMSFRSTAVKKIDGERWEVTGDLTIKGVTKEVVLATVFEGRGPDQHGADRLAFSAETKISRSEFGFNYNALLETGGVVVGDQVRIQLLVEAVGA